MERKPRNKLPTFCSCLFKQYGNQLNYIVKQMSSTRRTPLQR
ncbi:hypothetical protein LINPERPRIM_LOCUS9814, partial [Linum perenne]